MKIMSEITNYLNRRKAKKWLEAGDKNYKNLHKQYKRVASSVEVSRLRVDELAALRDKFFQLHTKLLSDVIFFEDTVPFRPYVILYGVRYNLDDEVILPPNPNKYHNFYVDDLKASKYGLPIHKTLAECILPRRMVVLKSFQQVIADADQQMLVTIKPHRYFTSSKFA